MSTRRTLNLLRLTFYPQHHQRLCAIKIKVNPTRSLSDESSKTTNLTRFRVLQDIHLGTLGQLLSTHDVIDKTPEGLTDSLFRVHRTLVEVAHQLHVLLDRPCLCQNLLWELFQRPLGDLGVHIGIRFGRRGDRAGPGSIIGVGTRRRGFGFGNIGSFFVFARVGKGKPHSRRRRYVLYLFIQLELGTFVVFLNDMFEVVASKNALVSGAVRFGDDCVRGYQCCKLE